MDLRKMNLNAQKAYRPYRLESIYCIITYVIVVLVLFIVFLAFGYNNKIKMTGIYISIIVVYTICNFFFNHLIHVMTTIEYKKKNWIKQELTICQIKKEASWSGHLWESIIPKLYPKEQLVDRYKIICTDKNGKEVILRSVMGGKKYQIIQDRIYNSLDTKCIIHYGKMSRIIIFFESNNIWTDKINHMF